MADLNIGNNSANVVINTKHNGSVIPQINNTYDLGTSALKWKNIYGDLKGNAATATKLATARSISLDTGVTSTATSFDGSNNITIPVNSIKESYLTWGGRNFNGAYGCIDAAMVSDLGANRLMFGKAAGITIQYSTDGGNNWTDYGASNSEKVGLFSSGHGFRIGKATKDTITANCMLRVIINTDNFGVYTQLNKFVIYLSTEGCNGCYCTIDASLESSPTTFTTFANKVPVSGWSGYNVINTSYITTYGNSPSNQYGLIRFTFGCTSVNTNYPGLNIIQIMGFGGVGWVTPSTMAKTGHLYSYDSSQNAAFPATVTAPTFSGALLGNASTATKATQDSAGQQINTTYIKGLSVSGKTITYTKGDGTTGTITTQDTNTTYGNATTSAAGLMSKDDKAKLDGITASADAVSFSRSLTSGTKIGTITINGTGTDLYAPTNTDTHWTTGITAGATGTTSNSATTNGNTFIKIKDNSTHRGQIKLVGSGATLVSSDANGVITINSTDNNTTYGSMSVSEGTTGTATTDRVLTATNLKGIINNYTDNAVSDAKTEITREYSSLINEIASQISLTVDELSRTVNANSDSIVHINNSINVTLQDINLVKTTMSNIQNAVNGKVSADEIKEWARFDGATLELGASNQPFKARLTTTELAFYQGSNKVAWISNNEFHILTAIITQSIGVGNFTFVDEGSMGFSLL